jgi:23S rRNA-/tRNA-specific pseudouridylate synthase
MSNIPTVDFEKYWLSTEGLYFMYREDRYDPLAIRATLYAEKDNQQIDDVRVSAGYGLPAKTHHQVINYFEARITLGQIKPLL